MNFKKTISYIIAAVIILSLSAASYGEISETNRAAIDQLRLKLKGEAVKVPNAVPEAVPSYVVKNEKHGQIQAPRLKAKRAPKYQPAETRPQRTADVPFQAPVFPVAAPAAAAAQSEASVPPAPLQAALRQAVQAAPAAPVTVPSIPSVRPVPALNAAQTAASPAAQSPAAPENSPAFIDNTGECFDVVVDPGHGGRYEAARNYSGDHWDPFSKTFLLPYNFGASSNGMYEHEWTLDTAKKVEEILNLTHTDAGFAEFCKILQRHSDLSASKIKKVLVNTHLTRRHSWEDDPEKNTVNVNKKYRLFDSPDSFSSSRGGPSEKMYPGRISFINQLSPDLVVCLHNNSSPNRNVRGFSSVIVPHFDFFSTINGIVTNGITNVAPNKVRVNEPKYQKVANFITSAITRPDKIDVKTMISDTATYFTGFRAFTQKFIGLRYLMVTWRYNTSSLFTSFMLFFMRENSIYENYRRSGGPEGYGGDNFYSSEEIIRYIRAALWEDLRSSNGYYAAKTSAEEYAGSHASPFVSDWAIPLHVNAITAYIELGYLSNARDRKLLKEKQVVVAESVAVGIYSLLAGLKPKKTEGIESPRGTAIDFAKYGRDKNSSGYFNISCRPLSF